MRLAIVALAVVLGGCQGAATTPSPTDWTSSPQSSAGPDEPTPTPTAPLANQCPPSGAKAIGKNSLPRLTLNCLGSSNRVDVGRLTGRPMVLNFWASWCGPCKIELPLLAQAHRQAGDAVRFVGVDVQDASGPAAKKLSEAGVTYPQLEDPRGLTRGPFRWTSGLPLTVFFDARGRMVGTERTAFRTYPEVVAALRRHLGVSLRDVKP